MIRATLPTVGVRSATPPYADIEINPFVFETDSSSQVIQHVKSIEGLGREDFKMRIQRSGTIEGFSVGSKVSKLKTITIQATLRGASIAAVRDLYDVLENFIFQPTCRWFGSGVYNYTL